MAIWHNTENLSIDIRTAFPEAIAHYVNAVSHRFRVPPFGLLNRYATAKLDTGLRDRMYSGNRDFGFSLAFFKVRNPLNGSIERTAET